jgi:hypothetical protein
MKHAEKESQGVRFYNEFFDKEIFNAKRWLVICEDGNSSGMDRKCYE